MKIRYHLRLFIHDQVTKVVKISTLLNENIINAVRIKMADSQPCDYTEYISRQGRSQLAQLLYEIAVDKVKQVKAGKTGKKRSKGRPRGDAYKLASEWLKMSKTNFYNLIKGHYATSNDMVNRLIMECGRVRPNETHYILRKDLVESQKKLDVEIDRLTKNFLPTITRENRAFPRRIRAP